MKGEYDFYRDNRGFTLSGIEPVLPSPENRSKLTRLIPYVLSAGVVSFAMGVIISAHNFANKSNSENPTNVKTRASVIYQGKNLELYDQNNDGLVDAIGRNNVAMFYTPDWTGQRTNGATEMSAEFRLTASNMQRDSASLVKLLQQ